LIFPRFFITRCSLVASGGGLKKCEKRNFVTAICAVRLTGKKKSIALALNPNKKKKKS
jgi:hypothetical protein